jgi:ectoine hydroxylase-related dioxygenase (phytanoyl-CoA dioxygenase family)
MDGTWWKTTAEEAAAVNHPWPYHTHTVNATCACGDLTHENGATEIWPGSHWEVDGPPQTNKPRDPEEHQRVIRECAAKRRLHFPPIQVTAPKGSVYFRDDRV